MKNKPLRLILMMTKYTLMGLFIQCLMLQLLLASDLSAQSNKSIREVKISWRLQNAGIMEVFSAIEEKTSFKFSYEKNDIDRNFQLDLSVTRNTSIAEILMEVSKQASLKFKQVNNVINVIKMSSYDKYDDSKLIEVLIQTRNVSGSVTSYEDDESLPGVNVVEKGTTNGTVTNVDGEFNLTVNEGATLVFSSVGYTSEEIAVGGRSVINLVMNQDIKQLQELVVVGYGTQQKKDLTGSVSSVRTDEIKDFTVGRVDQALVGKVAGVQIKQTTGEPGAAPQILVRGYNSIDKDASPLFVVDGHPIDNINTLNPNDIERIDILKDASATAIYGSRGTNGVVLITTKQGNSGQGSLDFNFYVGTQSATNVIDMMNAQEIAQFQFDSFVNRNQDEGNDISGDPTTWRRSVPQVVMDVLNGTNSTDTDWLDEIFKSSAVIQSYQLSSSGSSENLNYYISGEYFNQDGIIESSDFKRYSFRLNLESDVSSRLKIGARLNPSYSFRNDVPVSGNGENQSKAIISNAMLAQPFYGIFDENGEYLNMFGLDAAVNNTNPVAIYNLITDEEQIARMVGNTYLEYDIMDNLRFKTLVGVAISNNRNKYFRPQDNAFNEGIPEARNFSSQNINWLTTFTLNYDFNLNNLHNFNILAGYDVQKNINENNSLSSDNIPNNLVTTLNAASVIDEGSSFEREWSILSYLARVNYNFNEKYYLTASVRRDGSSRFGPNNKWGWFPSAAFAWRISEEPFMSSVNFIDNLKFRASYGVTGNNNIGDYLFIPTVGFENYIIGNSLVGGYATNRIANPNLQWEQQNEINIGLDLNIFSNRLSFNLDYFRKKNENLLLDVQIPGITGFTNNLTNIGTIQNSGFELTVNSRNLQNALTWTTNLNFSLYRNEILALGPEGDPIFTNTSGGISHITELGQPVGMFYGWINEGVIMNQQELDEAAIFNPGGNAETRVGDLRFKDINNDGVIDGDDRTVMGNPHPDFIYGMVNNFSYKNLELSISLQGIQGNDILQGHRNRIMNTRGRRNQMAIMNDYWKSEENPGNGKIPRPNNSPTGNNRGRWSSFHLDDGSFMRINNITLAYNFERAILDNLGLGSLRVYLSSLNPVTLTSYPGFNPDVSSSGSPLGPGQDWNEYPVMRTFSLGANVGF